MGAAVDRAKLAEAEHLRLRLSPDLFARRLLLPLRQEPAPYQLRLVRSRKQYVHVTCSRQAGKSTAGAILALHRALHYPRSLILVFGAAGRQANEILVKVQEFLDLMPVRPDLKSDSKTTIGFRNGSRIVALPSSSKTIRGPAAHLIIMDEAAYAADALFKAVSPMTIASRGRLVLLSTPNGTRGFFYDMSEARPDDWDFIEAPWTEIPHIDASQIPMQRVMLRELFDQEFLCRFLSGGVGLVYGAFSRVANVVDELPKSDAWTYILSLDPGVVDPTGFVVGCYRPNDPALYVPYAMQEPGLLVPDVAAKIKELRRTYPFSQVVVDTGGVGKTYEQELMRYHGVYAEAAEKTKKAAFIQTVNGMLAMGQVKVLSSCQELIHQLEVIPWNDTHTNQRQGFDDHQADAFLYLCRKATAYLAKPLPKALSPDERLENETVQFLDAKRREVQRANSSSLWQDDLHDVDPGDRGVPDWDTE